MYLADNRKSILTRVLRGGTIRIDTGMKEEKVMLFTLKEAAERVGVSPITLKRWLLAGKVHEVQRDRNGWRVFSQEDIARIQVYAKKIVPPLSKR